MARRSSLTHRRRRSAAPFFGAAALVFGVVAGGPLPAFPEIRLPERAAPPSALETPLPRPPAMGRGEFDLHWSRAKAAMAPCDDAVARARAALDFGPAEARLALRTARERCSAAAVAVGGLETPLPARGRRLVLLQEGREACQRSMIEKEMAMEAIEGFLAEPAAERLPETRIRVDAIERSSLNCRAIFAAADPAGAARSDLELVP